MTDNEFKEKYQREVRRLAALHAETRPKRSIWRKVADLLGVQPRLVVEPKHRISGPQLVRDGAPAWHSPEGQAKLPPPVLGPKCHLCEQRILAGDGLLSSLDGICGGCLKHMPAGPRAPQAPLHSEPDGPKAA